jgi:dUTP pyrophosphatase
MIKVKKLTKTAKLPQKAYPSDAGYDIFSDETKIIEPKTRETFSTGIVMIIPKLNEGKKKHLYIRIAPKSGLAVNQGLDVFAGVIDSGYRGELKICIFNSSNKPVKIEQGNKIAQAIPTIIYNDDIQEIEEIDDSDRGENGFGSTGK